MIRKEDGVWIAKIFGQVRKFVDFVAAQAWIDHVKGAAK